MSSRFDVIDVTIEETPPESDQNEGGKSLLSSQLKAISPVIIYSTGPPSPLLFKAADRSLYYAFQSKWC